MEEKIVTIDKEKNSKNDTAEIVKIIESPFLTKKQNVFAMTLIFLAVFIVLSIHWIVTNTGNVTLEQLIFHLMVPLDGTNTETIWDYIKWTFPRVFLIVFIVGGLIYLFEKFLKIAKLRKKKILYFISKVVLVISIISVLLRVDVVAFAKNQITASTLIEEEYIDPSETSIVFPEEKQNLIYIYLESIENTFASVEDGGMYGENRMPELTQIAKNNINFSNTDKMGGAYSVVGTTWTIAAMVSQTSGVPLKIAIDGNEYGNYATFLPGAYTLGEVLEENGYKNYLLIGSDSEFGGRKSYFESHGNYKIWDCPTAIQEGRMTEDEKVFWGYPDSDLFGYAKEQLLEISQNDEPFNYTMLTVDTHFPSGYVCEKCERNFKDRYSNVIRCSSKQVSEFVEWIQEQSFYENTTIVISGDHLTMQAETERKAAEINYGERTVYNSIINSRVEPEGTTTNRQFLTIDMYPTTLAALGAKIEGNVLGLGTNLFSGEQTLVEKYGLEYVRTEIEKKSAFYNKKILYTK